MQSKLKHMQMTNLSTTTRLRHLSDNQCSIPPGSHRGRVTRELKNRAETNLVDSVACSALAPIQAPVSEKDKAKTTCLFVVYGHATTQVSRPMQAIPPAMWPFRRSAVGVGMAFRVNQQGGGWPTSRSVPLSGGLGDLQHLYSGTYDE